MKCFMAGLNSQWQKKKKQLGAPLKRWHDTEMQHHENNKLIDQDLKSTLSQTLYFLK